MELIPKISNYTADGTPIYSGEKIGLDSSPLKDVTAQFTLGPGPEVWLAIAASGKVDGSQVRGCPLSCSNCSAGEDLPQLGRELLSAEQWGIVMQRLLTQQLSKVKIAGGEPTLPAVRAKLETIVSTVRNSSQKPRIVVVTNGYMPEKTRSQLIPYCKGNDVEWSTSIWAAGTDNDIVRKVPRNWNIDLWTHTAGEIIGNYGYLQPSATIMPGFEGSDLVNFLYNPDPSYTHISKVDGKVSNGIGTLHDKNSGQHLSVSFWRPQNESDMKRWKDELMLPYIGNIRRMLATVLAIRRAGVNLTVSLDYFGGSFDPAQNSFVPNMSTCSSPLGMYAVVSGNGSLSGCHSATDSYDTRVIPFDRWINSKANPFVLAAISLWSGHTVSEILIDGDDRSRLDEAHKQWRANVNSDYLYQPGMDPVATFVGPTKGCPLTALDNNTPELSPMAPLYEALLPDYLSFPAIFS